MQKRIIGIIVVYSPEKAFIAVKKFQEIIVSLSDNHIIRVVCNNKELNIGDIIGSNHNAEFSGWDEGIATVDLDAADAVILANDTFCTRRKFGENEFIKLKKTLELCRKKKLYITGELS